jgi:orotidine-5'-phosphate decarboxylase
MGGAAEIGCRLVSAIVDKLNRRADAAGTLLCVGLDPEMGKLPARFAPAAAPQFEFGKWMVDQTAEFAVAVKPNVAFYEARGSRGVEELERTIAYIRGQHPELVTICDAKRGDIGNTNEAYVTAIFDELGFDAVTLNPYLGREALAPFLARADKGCIILCRTSNAGAGEFQDLRVEGRPVWELVAQQVSTQWNANGNCMLVVGATYPEEMRRIRTLAPEMTLLVPGIGAQGGDLEAVVAAGLNRAGRGLIISSSRAILFSDDPARAARETRDAINAAREANRVAR